MALTDTDLAWWFTGGVSNTDPNASRGNARSTAQTVHELFGGVPTTHSGSVTSNSDTNTQNQFIDSARIGDGDDTHNDKWIVWVTGNNRFAHDKVVDFDSASGTFTLLTRQANPPQSGDIYRLFPVNNLFDDTTASEGALGDKEYRAIFLVNHGGETLDDNRMYFELIDPGPYVFEMAVEENDESSMAIPFSSGGGKNDPNISTGFGPSPHYSTPLTYDPPDQPSVFFAINRNMSAGNGRGVEIRRLLNQPNNFRKNQAVIAIIGEGQDQSASQVRSKALLVLGVTGFTPTATVTVDRGRAARPTDPAGTDGTVAVRGGTQLTARVGNTEAGGTPVPEVPVSWTVQAGPGSISSDAVGETDEDGEHTVVYTAPTDEGEVGNSATIRVRI